MNAPCRYKSNPDGPARRGQRRTTQAAGLATVPKGQAWALTSGGDRVTAAHDWHSIAHHYSSKVIVAGQTDNISVVEGPLDVGKRVAAAGPHVREECTRPRTAASM